MNRIKSDLKFLLKSSQSCYPVKKSLFFLRVSAPLRRIFILSICIKYNTGVPGSEAYRGLPLPVDHPGNGLQDAVVSFLGMRHDASRAVLDAVIQCIIAVAVEQVQRTPAEQAGLPLLEIVTGEKTALLVGEKLVVHRGNSSLENFALGA
jgi:hypothetical protein